MDEILSREALITLSAYTGFMLIPMEHYGEMLQKCENALGMPIWSHEYADEKVQAAIRKALLPELQEIIKQAFGEYEKEA